MTRHKLSIIHINTHDVAGGAAKVAWRLAEAQRQAGHTSKMLVGHKMINSPHSESFPIETDETIAEDCRRESLLFYQYQGSHKLINHPLVQSSDIVHLHNLHGDYFNPFSISALSHSKPVIWTLHDMQSITGHCAHSFDCEKWQTGCGNCPYLGVEPAISADTTAVLWRDKQQVYNHSHLHVVTPSRWLKNKVERSILNAHPVELIHNGVDTNVFRPYPRDEMRRKFGLPQNSFLLGVVAHGGALANQWKGGQYTQAVLKQFLFDNPDCIFVNIGASGHSNHPRIINIPHQTQENELAQAYSTLDVFLYTPVADNCPLVVIEALGCGVPLITFNIGGIPELVRDGIEGLVTPFGDVSALIQSTRRLAIDPDLREKLGHSARVRAKSKFSHAVIAGQYETLYREIYEASRKRAPEVRIIPLNVVPKIILTPDFLAAETIKLNIGELHDVQHKNTGAIELDSICGTAPAATTTVDHLSAAAYLEQSNGKDITGSDRERLQEYKTPTIAPISSTHIRAKSPAQKKRSPDYILPKISIITPSFNQVQFLEECIHSILSQNYPNLEYIIMDGGSSDGSVEIIKKYEKYLAYWQSQPDGGQYQAINAGFERSTGEIMGWLNSDDKLHPQSLFKVAYIFSKHVDVDWIEGLMSGWDKAGQLTYIEQQPRRWSRADYLRGDYRWIQQESTFWRRSLWDKAGCGLDTSFKMAADLDLWARFFRYGQLYRVFDLLGGFRGHGNQRSVLMLDQYVQEAERIVYRENALFQAGNQGPLLPGPQPIIINHGKFGEYVAKATPFEATRPLIDKACLSAALPKGNSDDHISVIRFPHDTESLAGRFLENQETRNNANLPFFSVITPSYNQAKFIEETVQSVIAQNYPNYEHIVIDGGSTDGTVDILQKYKHLKWVSEPDRGQSDALNKGFQMATGDIIAWINSDDWYEPKTFEMVADYFLNNPNKNIVMGNCQLVDKNGVVFDTVINVERGFAELKQFWVNRSIPTQPAIFFRRHLLDQCGLLDESLHYAMDYDLWLRMAKKHRFYHLDKVVANYRFHDEAKGGDHNWGKFVPEWLLVHYRHCTEQKSVIKVSVVIPCYNYAHYLPEAVNSVLSQTYRNFEIIIVNDGSTDDTVQIAEQLIARNQQQQIRLISQANSGKPAIARNVGIAQAAGQYILCLDADDKIHPTFLEKTVSVLDNEPEIAVVYTHIQHFGAIDTVWPSGPFTLEQQLRTNNMPYCSLYRREVFTSVDGYTACGYEDWDFWLGALERGWRGQLIPEPLFYYRKGHSGVLSQDNQNHQKNVAQIILNHPKLFDQAKVLQAQNMLEQKAMANDKHRITYLITSVLGVTGGNQTLLQHTNYLAERGHEVTIVTYTDKPAWFDLKARVIKVPRGQKMAPYVPPSDVVISTYFMNTAELLDVDAPVKIYFAQGDQYIFADDTPSPNPEVEAMRRQMRELSKTSYLYPDICFVANSHNLANTVEKNYGRKADAIIPACTDQTIFRPLQRSWPGSRRRILIVGPDARGSDIEPLIFKGIGDIKEALQLLSKRFANFTAVRMSNSPPDIFKDFPCEFYQTPSDEMKTFLYGTADILIYASHYDSCPFPPQEAMAAGAAVVCTATSGAMEYCKHEENCLLVPINAPQAIAEAVERLITDTQLRERLIQGGFATAQQYPREREWNEVETVFDRLVTQSKVTPKLESQMFGEIDLIKKAQQTKNWPEAIRLLTTALGQPGSNGHKPELYNRLGYCYVKNAQLFPAEMAFERGLAFAPDNVNLLGNLADLYLQQKRYDQATEYLNRALRINPDDVPILLSLGDCAIQLGAFDVALMAFKRVQNLAPQTEGLNEILAELATVAEPEPADEQFLVTPESFQQNGRLLLAAGLAAVERGEMDTAITEFVQVAEANPEFAAAFVAWGSTLQALGRLAEAAPVLRRAAELVPTLPDLPNQLGVIYVQLAEWEQAEAAFWQAHQLAPEDVNTLLNLIDLYRAAGNYDAASEMVNRALAVDPAHPEVLLAFGQICADLGDVGGVELAIERLHGQPGADVLRQRLAGETPEPATEALNNGHQSDAAATGLESSAFDEQLALAQSAGDWPAAIELLTAELARRQTDADLWNSLGVAYVMTGQLEAAEDALRQGLAVAPEHLSILHNLADIYLQLEAFDQATACLNRALQIDPNDVPLLLSLGNCAIQLGGFETALAAFERVRELAPDTAGIDEVLAQLAALQ